MHCVTDVLWKQYFKEESKITGSCLKRFFDGEIFHKIFRKYFGFIWNISKGQNSYVFLGKLQ